MSSSSIIVIGAGAAGLQACCRLAEAGFPVRLLEASAEPGGRIHSITPRGFSAPVEGGAEFIHGTLPLSLRLAKAAGVALEPVKAEMIRWTKDRGWGDVDAGNGAGNGDGDQDGGDGDTEGGISGADWGLLMETMAGLTADLPIAEFLQLHFPGERWAGLTESVRRFAEGYDLADLSRASTLALYREWSGEEGGEEYRPVGGYRGLVSWLAAECRRLGAELHFSSPVVGVDWEKGRVRVRTEGGQLFEADRLVVSVSLGVLGSGGLGFNPVLPELPGLIGKLGYGSVVKVLLEFNNLFWLKKKSKEQTLFILSDQPVPTWWTQSDDASPVLTGWVAGERMRIFLQLDEAGKIGICLRSLATIFGLEQEWLRQELAGISILDWAGAPYVRGGYSFETVEAAGARAALLRPVEETLYFCGEALYEGESLGTVEAALQSGWDVAEKIIAR